MTTWPFRVDAHQVRTAAVAQRHLASAPDVRCARTAGRLPRATAWWRSARPGIEQLGSDQRAVGIGHALVRTYRELTSSGSSRASRGPRRSVRGDASASTASRAPVNSRHSARAAGLRVGTPGIDPEERRDPRLHHRRSRSSIPGLASSRRQDAASRQMRGNCGLRGKRALTRAGQVARRRWRRRAARPISWLDSARRRRLAEGVTRRRRKSLAAVMVTRHHI